MRVVLLFCLSFFITQQVLAAPRIKFKKIKGNSALVIIPKGFNTAPGDVYYLSTDDPDAKAGQKPDEVSQAEIAEEVAIVEEVLLNGRTLQLGIEVDFEQVDEEESDQNRTTTNTNIDVELSMGYNLGQFELGGIIGYISNEEDSDSQAAVKDDFFKFGGFGEFNIVRNVPGNVFVPAVGAKVLFYNGGTESSNADTDDSKLEFVLYGAAKLFLWSDNIALVPKIGYITGERDQKNDNVDYEWKRSGYNFSVGLVGYTDRLF